MAFEYHYSFDAATLLEQCSSELQEVMRTSRSMGRRTCLTLMDLQTALSASQDLLLQHLQSLLEQERMYASPALHELFAVHDGQESTCTAANHNNNQTSASVVGFLRMVAEHRQIESQRQSDNNIKESKMDDDQDDDSYHAMKNGDDEVDPFHLSPCCYYPNRNASDAMLFRLIVVLQLCLVRLDDARYVLTGRRRRRSDDGTSISGAVISSTSSSRSNTSHFHQSRAITHHHNHFHLYHRTVCHTLVHAAAYMGTLLYGTGYLASTQRHQVQWRIIMCSGGGGSSYSNNPAIAAKSMAWTAGGLGMAAVTAGWLRQTWNTWWMSSKIVDSTRAVELWNRNWHAMQAANNLKQRVTSSRSSTFSSCRNTNAVVQADVKSKTAMMSTCAVKADRVVLYSLNSRPENALCNSKGEARFLVLKRAMDLVYTSMDSSPTSSTATRFFDPLDQHVAGGAVECPWRLQLAEAAFYASIGDRHRAMEVAASSRAARDLLHHLWGGNNTSYNNNSMASLPLPPIKTLSLRASQLLHQGAAAVADRIEICGITCFVLSREPIPEMASAIKHFHHRHGRRSSLLRTLSSIHEDEEEDERHQSLVIPQRRRSRTPFEKRNVIFHLTGGGFFSHTIASDLPNLLHWSEVTGAVVICPEYGLLPEHTFPSALGHVERVYKALLSSNVAKSLLGFEVNRLIVTGESAGGHLAVSLCTKLISDSMDKGVSPTVILPNALLCSCPVLDLSLGTSDGAEGKITPETRGDVVTAISDAYLPSEYRIEKQDPRASPLYATNEVLCKFPPTSICFDTENDSSVLFYRRLEMAGVHDCVLRAVAPHHFPNNYIGLGMTGFPEESHEQYDCISKWLCSEFGSM